MRAIRWILLPAGVGAVAIYACLASGLAAAPPQTNNRPNGNAPGWLQPLWGFVKSDPHSNPTPTQPATVQGIQQPSFLAPYGTTPEVILPNGDPNESSGDPAARAAASNSSGRTTLWRQFLGTTPSSSGATTPATPTAQAATGPPANTGPPGSVGRTPANAKPASNRNPPAYQAGGNLAPAAPGTTYPGSVVGGTGPLSTTNSSPSSLQQANSGMPATQAYIPTDADQGTWRSGVGGLWQQATTQSAASNQSGTAVGAVAAGGSAGPTGPPPAEGSSTQAKLLGPLTKVFVGSEEQESAMSALWRPLAMRQDAEPVARPSEAPSATTPATTASTAQPSQRAGTRPPDAGAENSLWLRPFYLTNPNQPGTRNRSTGASGTASDRSGTRSNSLAEAAGTAVSPFFRQFSLSSTDDLRTPAETEVAPFKTEEKAWNEGWTVYFPTIANPFGFTYDPNDPGVVAAADARLVSFLQEGLPQPDDLDLETGESIPAGEGGSEAGQAGEGATEEGGLAEAESLGTEPEDTSLEFLRRTTVLLEPGESQFDIGIAYLLSESDFPILLTAGGVAVGVDEAHFRVRELTVPMEYRMGLTKRVQGFVGMPVGWANAQIAIDSFDAFKNDGGIGDVDFGLTMQLVDRTVDSPYWIATIAGTAPTGGDPFTGAFSLAPSGPSLGSGFWSVAGVLTFVQQYDPLVVFYGLGARQYFAHEYAGVEIEPGTEYSYTLGVGFAVNERVTLSSRFRGSYIEEIKVDGERIFGSNLEPMTIRMSATISKPKERLVEPFVEFGLTDDSISAVFGVDWTY